MQEGDLVLSHLSVFKEIVADLGSMEVQYEDENLGLLLLCSLPSSYASFRDTILLSHDELTLAEVCEALQSKEKMKGMVQTDGSSSRATLCMSEADQSKDPQVITTIVARAMTVEAAPSPKVPRRNSVSIARRNLI